MTDKAAIPEREGPSRARSIGARALTVVAILLALVGMLAYYVAHTALDEAGFKAVSQNMIEDDAIRTQVANTAVDAAVRKRRRGGGDRGATASGAERVGACSGRSLAVRRGPGGGRGARAAARAEGLGADDDRDAAATGEVCWTTSRSSSRPKTARSCSTSVRS